MQMIARLPLVGTGRTLLLLAGLVLLFWLWLEQPQREWQGGVPTVDLTLDGQVYRVARPELLWLEQLAELHFSGREAEARALVETLISERLDHLFAEVEQRLPAYADWYFSLSAEYTRYGMLALSASGVMDEERLAGRGRELLFPEQGFADELELLRIQTDASLLRQAALAREGWLAELMAQLEQQAQPLPAPVAESESLLSLDVMADRLTGYQQPEFIQRTSIGAVAGVGVALGPAMARLLRRQAAAGGSRALAARGASKGAARAGSAAGGGALVCSPGGPLAVGCALLAGAAAWLVTDMALLRVDEMRNREDLIQSMEQEIALIRRRMEGDLLAAYDRAIEAQYRGMQGEVVESFVPARQGR